MNTVVSDYRQAQTAMSTTQAPNLSRRTERLTVLIDGVATEFDVAFLATLFFDSHQIFHGESFTVQRWPDFHVSLLAVRLHGIEVGHLLSSRAEAALIREARVLMLRTL